MAVAVAVASGRWPELVHRCQSPYNVSATGVQRPTTPWKRACDGHRSLKMCDVFQSALSGPTIVARPAAVSSRRPLLRRSARDSVTMG